MAGTSYTVAIAIASGLTLLSIAYWPEITSTYRYLANSAAIYGVGKSRGKGGVEFTESSSVVGHFEGWGDKKNTTNSRGSRSGCGWN